jgi:hypothetical protein
MGELWGSLVPLIIGSALVPIQIVITTMLLRSGAGRMTAVAWLGGMTAVRLGQGLVFGLILGSSTAEASASDGPGTPVSLLLLVVAILFYLTAIKQLLKHPDEDAPPPKWMAMIETATPGKAFGLGTGILMINIKLWVFTLGAISAIGLAGLGQGAAVITFVAFVLLAESIHIVVIGVAFAMPTRSAAMLDGIVEFLARYNRFLVKALIGLGLL